MNIVIVGPPGSGKGTQAIRLSRALGIPHIASGDLLRAVRAQDTPLGNEAKRYIDAGQLVPDEVTIRIIEERLEQPDAQSGFILDGFPRTLAQAKRLDQSLAEHQERVDVAIYIIASRDTVLDRMRGRWICQQCGTVYHIPHIAPTAAGRCDVCGAPLYQRTDETPEIQARRWGVYERDTLPIVAYYREHSVLAEVDGEQAVDTVTQQILRAVAARQPAGASSVATSAADR